MPYAPKFTTSFRWLSHLRGHHGRARGLQEGASIGPGHLGACLFIAERGVIGYRLSPERQRGSTCVAASTLNNTPLPGSGGFGEAWARERGVIETTHI